MEEVDEIRSRIFRGVVPVRIKVAALPAPLCFDAPRCLSLGAFAYSALSHWIKSDSGTLWFAHKSRPVKWQFPLGVIYDAFTPDPTVFWALDIEVQNSPFPEDPSILRCESAEPTSFYFRHSLKESLYLTTGGSSWLTQSPTLPHDIEQAALRANYEAFAPLFQTFIRGIETWRRWPVNFVDKALNSKQCLLKLSDNPDATLADALGAKKIAADSLIVHGVPVDKQVKIAEAISLMLYPDGFLYIVTSSPPQPD
jgi:hypothetical protein